MSKVKRILSVIMAMVMVLAMSVPTFAAEKSATIKVTGLDKDATVTYKQIIEPDDTTATGWKFTDPNDAKAFDKNLDEQMIIWKLLKMKSGSTKMTNEPDNVKAYSAQKFANAIAKITTSTPVKDANDQLQRAGEAGEISWTVNKAGVYVVNATSDYKVGNKVKYTYSTMAGYVSFDNYDKETGLPETLNNATITAKSSSIDITKKNNEKDGVVEVGKVVEYTVETKIPYVNDANPIKRFEVTDVISGAEYVTNQEGKLVLKVTVGTGAETEELVDVNNNSFTLDLTSYLANNDHANQSVVIKYSAKVTGTVVNNTVEWNDGKNESQTATDTLYTGTVTLTKTGENGAKLENAEFVLVRKDKDSSLKYAVATQTNGKAEYTVNSWGAEKDATIMKTDKNGNIVVKGLDDSTSEMTYEFKETKAPEGYSINETNADVTWDKDGEGLNAETRTGAAAMTDTKLNTLPSTGGIGTTIFTIGGCAIMIVAAGLFFATRRKTQK
jgi:LPXTG-motif cell wall-anchored protein